MADYARNVESVSIDPRRAWWRRILLPRFSLRTMLIALTLVCVVGAIGGRWITSQKQRRFVEALMRIDASKKAEEEHYDGGYISIVYDDGFDPFMPDETNPNSSWFAKAGYGLLGRDYFHDIVKVKITNETGRELPDQAELMTALYRLNEIKSIKSVTFGILYKKYFIDCFGIASRLQNIPQLNLVISCERLPDDLASYENVKNLRIQVEMRSKAGAAYVLDAKMLNDLNRLEGLTIHTVFPSTIINFDSLTELKQLKRLRIYPHCFDSQGIQSLAENFPALDELTICNNSQDLSYLKPLKNIRNLKKLRIYNANYQKAERDSKTIITEMKQELKSLLPKMDVDVLDISEYDEWHDN